MLIFFVGWHVALRVVSCLGLNMGEYVAGGTLGTIPDDLTLPQFILDSSHPTRPIRKQGIPWLVDDTSGRQIGFEEVSHNNCLIASTSYNLSFCKILRADPWPYLRTRKCSQYQIEYP
jgi:hypothetical protein